MKAIIKLLFCILYLFSLTASAQTIDTTRLYWDNGNLQVMAVQRVRVFNDTEYQLTHIFKTPVKIFYYNENGERISKNKFYKIEPFFNEFQFKETEVINHKKPAAQPETPVELQNLLPVGTPVFSDMNVQFYLDYNNSGISITETKIGSTNGHNIYLRKDTIINCNIYSYTVFSAQDKHYEGALRSDNYKTYALIAGDTAETLITDLTPTIAMADTGFQKLSTALADITTQIGTTLHNIRNQYNHVIVQPTLYYLFYALSGKSRLWYKGWQ